MKSRVILMNPPTAAPSSEILLNLAYLSSTLKQAGHEVLVLDATAPYNQLSEEEIKRRILEFKPDFIGVTLTINFIPQTYEYLKRLKNLKIPIIAGGPHANCLPEEVLQHDVDIVIMGEGENTILEVTEHFVGEKNLKDIEGICFKDKNGAICYTKRRSLIQNLDEISFPDYDSFPIKHYSGSSNPNSNPIFWSIFSSRGCPFNCTFCSSHNVFGRTFRSRSPENVFNEIQYLAEKFDAETFAFQDDEAFINKKRIIEFCKLVEKSRFHLRFSARLRIDSLDAEMLAIMKSSGFKRLAFGIESFNDETLKNINKKYNVAKIHEGFKVLKEVNFSPINFNNIIGFPWETPEHFKMNLKEISKIDKSIKYYSGSIVPIPYPGTALYNQYHEQYGFTNWWLDSSKNSPLLPVNTFFTIFLSTKMPLYQKDIFWNHSPEMLKAIEHFSWALSKKELKQFYSKPMFYLIYTLCKISHFLWKKKPKLEKTVFTPLSNLFKKQGIDKKAKFIYQG